MRVASSILVLAVAATGYSQAQMSPEVMLEGGIRAEVVDGNLTEAIAIYEGVASRPDVDRAVAAKALLHLAGCYEKLGDDTALAVYQRIRDDYGDVAEAAASARERLSALSQVDAGEAAQGPIALPSPDEVVDLGGGLDYSPSPDGRYGIVTAYLEDSQNVGLFEYSTQQVTWVTDFPDMYKAQADGLVVSADGTRAAYAVALREEGAIEIHVATLSDLADVVVYRTMDPDLLREVAGVPVWLLGWTPDNALIGRRHIPGDWRMYFKLDISTGEFTQIASVPWGPGGPSGSVFGGTSRSVSPDGRHIVIERTVDGNTDLYLLAVDGAEMSRLTDHPALDREGLWSRDGSHVLFVSERLGGRSLWAVEVKNGAPAGVPILLQRDFTGTDLSWAGDRLWYWDGGQNKFDVFTMPLDGASSAPVGSPRGVPHVGSNVGPEWSSRGDLAFYSMVGDQPMLVILHADGEITKHQVPDETLAFPRTNTVGFNVEGTVVAIGTWGRAANSLAFFDLESDSWSPVEIPAVEPAWRVQTGYAVFQGGEDDFVLYYPVTKTDRSSPDFGHFEIRRLDAQGGETTVYTSSERLEGGYMWLSRDGRSLRFTEGRKYRQLDIASGTLDEVMAIDDSLDPVRGPVSSADGRTVAALLAVDPWDPANAPYPAYTFRIVEHEAGTSKDVTVPVENLFGQATGSSDLGRVVLQRFKLSPSGDRLAFVGQARFQKRRFVDDDPLERALSAADSR